jgi:hypothetical protein
MRDEILGHIFVEGLQIVTVEHVLKIGANPCITLVYGHPVSPLSEPKK